MSDNIESTILKEGRKEVVLSSVIHDDEITQSIQKMFDYQPERGVVTESISIPTFPTDFQIGLLIGGSGSGKSTILRTVFGGEENVEWALEKSIASHFKSATEASQRFGAVGLNSIPSWLKPYHVLSNGEKFRADMARRLRSGAVIDEFTSVVNRDVAISCSTSIEKYIRSNRIRNVVFASCHDDIIPYLRPDWIYNTDTHEFYNGRYLCRPKITIKLHGSRVQAWDIFKRYHYLSGEINKASRCYIGTYDDLPVVFGAILSLPCGTMKHAFREHRVVVLPDFQGMGIGNRFSEALAEAYHRAGCRYFGKTANPRMGEHRDKSTLWKPTSKNHVLRKDYIRQNAPNFHNMLHNALCHVNRDCYSHEYIGDGVSYPYILDENNHQPIANGTQINLFDIFPDWMTR